MSDDGRDLGRIADVELHGGRRERLISAVEKLRTKGTFPADRAFQLAAWILLPLGVSLILLAWYGASNTTRLWQQIPYMISGGLLGLGLIFAGGFGYFAAWLTRMLDEGRRQSAQAIEIAEQTLAALDRIEAALNPNGQRSGAGQMLVAVGKGTLVHRPDCPLVEGKSDVRRVAATDRGLKPCQVCRPVLTPARAAQRRAR